MKHKSDDAYYNRYIRHVLTKQRDTRLYIITICKHRTKDYVKYEELLEVQTALVQELGIPVIHGRVERHGKYKQLHLHFLSSIPKHIRYGKYTQYKDFRIHFQWIANKLAAYKYIDKHYSPYNNTTHDTLMANYFAYHYGFQKRKKK